MTAPGPARDYWKHVENAKENRSNARCVRIWKNWQVCSEMKMQPPNLNVIFFLKGICM